MQAVRADVLGRGRASCGRLERRYLARDRYVLDSGVDADDAAGLSPSNAQSMDKRFPRHPRVSGIVPLFSMKICDRQRVVVLDIDTPHVKPYSPLAPSSASVTSSASTGSPTVPPPNVRAFTLHPRGGP